MNDNTKKIILGKRRNLIRKFMVIVFLPFFIWQGASAQNLLDDPGIWVTGRNQKGQLGNNSPGENVMRLKRISEEGMGVAAGEYHSYLISEDGRLWSTGSNDHGQLGDGSTDERSAAVEVVGGTDIMKVTAGKYHGLFIKNDGTLWAMGRNDYGQLGDGTTENRSEPVQENLNTRKFSIQWEQ